MVKLDLKQKMTRLKLLASDWFDEAIPLCYRWALENANYYEHYVGNGIEEFKVICGFQRFVITNDNGLIKIFKSVSRIKQT